MAAALMVMLGVIGVSNRLRVGIRVTRLPEVVVGTGNAVEVGGSVSVETAEISVNPAARVAVAGGSIGENVSVACAMTGVLVGGTVLVTAAGWVKFWEISV